jgi:hypothetical protein
MGASFHGPRRLTREHRGAGRFAFFFSLQHNRRHRCISARAVAVQDTAMTAVRRFRCSVRRGQSMDTNAFDTVTRAATAAVSRRGSLLMLGGAALGAAGATPSVGEAKKKKGKDCKKKAKQRCSNDTAACIAEAPVACEGDAECIADVIGCCNNCSANAFLTCLIAASGSAAARLT